MHRRALFSSVFALVTLTACAPIVPGSPASFLAVSQEAIDQVQLITTAIKPLAIVVAATPGIDLGTANTFLSYVQEIEAAAAKIIPGVLLAVAKPSVQTIGDAFDGVVKTLAGHPMPDQVKKVLAAVQAILPLVELAVGIASALAAAPGGATVDDAMATLRKGLR